jgi:hypothetical protein
MFHNMCLDLNHSDEKSLKASQLLDQIVVEPPNYSIKATELKQGLGRAFVPGKLTQSNDKGFFDLRIKRGIHSEIGGFDRKLSKENLLEDEYYEDAPKGSKSSDSKPEPRTQVTVAQITEIQPAPEHFEEGSKPVMEPLAPIPLELEAASEAIP